MRPYGIGLSERFVTLYDVEEASESKQGKKKKKERKEKKKKEMQKQERNETKNMNYIDGYERDWV